MRIYLDTCCLNRPFDNQSNETVRRETEAVKAIWQAVSQKKISLAWSFILDREIAKSRYKERVSKIMHWRRQADIFIEPSEAIEKQVDALTPHGIKRYDATHVASAAAAGCDYFITSDIRLLKRARDLGLPALYPLEFVAILGGAYNDSSGD